MLELLRRNPVAVLLAVAMHALIVAIMVVGLDWRKQPKPRIGETPPVQAKLIDQSRVAERAAELKAEQQRKQQEKAAAERREQQRLDALRKQQEAEKRRLAKLEQERKAQEKAEAERKEKARQAAEAEQRRLAELERKQQAEAKRLKELEQQRAAEEKQRAEAQAAREKAEREAKAKAEREARDKAAREAKAKAEREAREKAERAARAKAEAEAKAKAEQAAREAEMAAMLEGERLAGERDRVLAAIQAKVERSWLRPPGTDNLECHVRVRLGANGSVLLAQVVKSSGNGAFDRSVEAAVRKADPLPMPESSALQAQFRDITFVFDPDNN